MKDDRALRQHLLDLLRSRDAHLDFDQVITGWPVRLRGIRPAGMPHTAWQLLEHMRIAQWDILEFSRNPQVSRGPLAPGRRPTRQNCLVQKHPNLSQRPEGHREARHEPVNRSARPRRAR